MIERDAEVHLIYWMSLCCHNPYLLHKSLPNSSTMTHHTIKHLLTLALYYYSKKKEKRKKKNKAILSDFGEPNMEKKNLF